MSLCRRAHAIAILGITYLITVSSAGGAQPVPPEFQVNSIINGSQGSAAIAMQPNGDFVTTWLSAHITGFVAVHRRFTQPVTALGPDSLVSPINHAFAPVIALGDSHYVVAWTERFGTVDTVRAQLYDTAGAPIGAAHKIANAAGVDVGSGVYFYRLRANGQTLTRKMVLVK